MAVRAPVLVLIEKMPRVLLAWLPTTSIVPARLMPKLRGVPPPVGVLETRVIMPVPGSSVYNTIVLSPRLEP